jgi:hypothetical protein
MKICIIGLPRCGTTALYFFIRGHLNENYRCENEPWNKKRYVEFTDECFYKLVINDTVENQLVDDETIYDFTYDIINKFDKIIFLRRKNVEGMKNSLAHQLIYIGFGNEKYRNKFANQYYEKWIPIFEKISENKKVYFYEDLYTDYVNNDILEVCEYIGIKFDKKIWEKYMDIKIRQPYQTKKNILI